MNRTFVIIAISLFGAAMLAVTIHCAVKTVQWLRTLPSKLRYRLQTLRFTQVSYDVHRSCSRPGRKAAGYAPVVVARGNRRSVRLKQTYTYW